MDLLYNLAIVAAVVAIVWWAFRPRYAFVIRINDGQARVTAGKVTSAFVQDAREVCAEANVRRGWIAGTRHGRRLTLRFSGSVPR